MQELNDTSVLEKFVQNEVEKPSPRKIVGNGTIYLSRLLDHSKKFGSIDEPYSVISERLFREKRKEITMHNLKSTDRRRSC